MHLDHAGCRHAQHSDPRQHGLDDVRPARPDTQHPLRSGKRPRPIPRRRRTHPVIDVRRPERGPRPVERHEERIGARARLGDRVRGAVVQQECRAIAHVHVDVSDRGVERGGARGGGVHGCVGVPVAPDDTSATGKHAW